MASLLTLPGTLLASGVPGTFLLSSNWSGSPVVVSDGSEHIVVVWSESYRSGSDRLSRILARRFDGAGRPLGEAFPVNPVMGSPWSLGAGMDAEGGLVVAWHQHFDDGNRVLLHFFDRAGAPQGTPVEVDRPDIFFDGLTRAGNGDICIVWAEWESDGGSVFARTFDCLGVPLSDAVELGVAAGGRSHMNPAVAAGADGRFFVVWKRLRDNEYEVLGRLIGRDARPASSLSALNEPGRFVSELEVGAAPDGGFLVSWTASVSGTATSVFVRQYDADGRARGEAVEVGRDPRARHHAVAMDGDGGFLAVWESVYHGLFGQYLDSTGFPIGGKFYVAPPDHLEYGGLGLAPGADGNLLVAMSRPYTDLLGRLLPRELRGGTFHVTSYEGLPGSSDVVRCREDGYGYSNKAWVWRTGGSRGRVSVAYRTTDGSATAGEDYVPLAGVVTFSDGEFEARAVDLQVIDDQVFDDDEDYFFHLVDGGAGDVVEPSVVRVLILEDEAPPFGRGPAPLGPERRAGDDGVVDPESPDLAPAQDGGVVLVWSEPDPAGLSRVRGARLDADGRAVGEVLEVGTGFEPEPVVAASPGGDISVAWRHSDDIYWRRFDSAGRPLGDPVVVAEAYYDDTFEAHGRMSRPRIARLADGGDAVAWLKREDGESGGHWESFRMRRVDAQGELGDVVVVTSNIYDPMGGHALAADSDGSLVYAFVYRDYDFPDRLQVDRFDADLHFLAGFTVTESEGLSSSVDVAVGADGTCMVVWSDMGLRLTRQMTPLGPAFRLSNWSAGSQSGPQVASGSSGEFMVVWQSRDLDGSGLGVFGRRFGARGRPNGRDFLLHQGTAGDQWRPRVAIDPSGRLFAAWMSREDDEAPATLWVRAFLPTSCTASDTRLCLQRNRFAVEVTWRDPRGRTGSGRAVPMTADTGAFWFFGEKNLELMVKVLDGTGINGHFWVFYGSLSNVGYTVTVTDTDTGAIKSYTNASGRFASKGDVSAFLGD